MKEDWTDDWDQIRQYRETLKSDLDSYDEPLKKMLPLRTEALINIIWATNQRLEHLENIVERLTKIVEAKYAKP